MKIIQIVPYYHPHLGGMENCVKELSDRLALKGCRVEVFTSDISCRKEKLESSSNLKIHYLKGYEIAHTPIIPSLFFNLLKIPRNSVMHVHVAQAFVPEVVWLVSKIRKIPYIAHIHSDVGPSGKMGFLLPFYKNFFLKTVLNSSSKIVVPTKDYIYQISNKYAISKAKIREVPHGVNLNNFKNLSDELHNPIRLLFVGRLTVQKNIPLLVKSFKKITENNLFDIELHIVGDGEDKKKVNQLISTLNIENRVVMHGWLHGRRLYDIYKNSDIFVLVSDYETFGIVLIEAMASGLPLIASNINGVRDVVEDNKTGLLVKRTPEDIARAIEKLLHNPQLRKRLIKNGLEEVKKYDWDKIVEKFEIIYCDVLNEAN